MGKPILIFDSGVGGLSIYRGLKEALPQTSFCYASDSLYLPYGEQSDEFLLERCPKIIFQLARDINPELVVIACNTLSTLVLERLRRHLSIPVVGVVPAIKPAALNSQKKKIALLATPATIARTYIQALVQTYASDCDVQLIGCSDLVALAEEKVRGKSVCTAVSNIVRHFPLESVDTIVLGCTHFPLLKEELYKCLPSYIELMDSTDAIIRRVMTLIDSNVNHNGIKQPHHTFVNTALLGHPLKETLQNEGFSFFKVLSFKEEERV